MFDTVANSNRPKALKICVLGPPGSGKTHLAKQLSQHYKLPRIHVQGVIKSTLDRLNAAMARLEQPDVCVRQ